MPQDRYKYFRVEARELLDQLTKGTLDLEKGPPAPDHVPRLLRFAHTLKGAARVVKQPEVAELAHAIEEALAPIRASQATPERERIDTVLSLLDDANRRIAELDPPREAAPEQPNQQQSQPKTEENLRTLRADIDEMDALLRAIAESRALLSGLTKEASSLERLRHLAELALDQLGATRGPASTPEPALGARGLVEQLATELGSVEASVGLKLEQIDRELTQLHETAAGLRLLPAGVIFNVLERVARDTAQSTGKRVTFEARGADVRLDAQVLGTVRDALVQVVKNAIAHGIEGEQVRISGGKQNPGKVSVEVSRRGHRVLFACQDDGAGFDIEAVRRAAERNGAGAADLRALDAEGVIGLLLKGGISTSRSVTEVSGRGIGLDVLRAAAGQLGGEVSVRTNAREGTRIEILVPVSMTSLPALVVETQGRAAVIPLDAVRRSLRVAAGDLARSADGQSLVFEGKVIPFRPLARALELDEAPGERDTWSAVIVEAGGNLAAVGVDRLLGSENVLLRALPPLSPAAAIVAGATLDADGRPRLVLDPNVLVSGARSSSPRVSTASSRLAPVLIVDDSLTTRMLEQSILESAGYEVELATSGEDAVEKSRQKRYALYLVDVEMPGMSGFEFIEHLQRDPVLKTIPAILVTSRNSPEDFRRGVEAGARAHIVKSEFNQADLLARIKKLLER